ncbi:MAG: hypothetical protein H6556_13870 [Lewinellaceae bacterium]|nr:hypothetical protein [Lewinellaceae bacterium]
MKNLFIPLFILTLWGVAFAQGGNEGPAFRESADLKISNTSVVFDGRLDQLIFTIEVEGQAGNSKPTAFGQMDGAPVLGYVFPTTLKPVDVGFSDTEGIVAMALTSHPDFDDTPLWDEDNDRNYANDGAVWHPHWVVLAKDSRVAGGLAVKQFDPNNSKVTLPPTNPGMPMYMDSPGYPVITKGNTIRVVIPAYRINNQTKFNFDAVTAYMQVNASNADYPMLGVYAVYSIASGDLSLPYTVSH